MDKEFEDLFVQEVLRLRKEVWDSNEQSTIIKIGRKSYLVEYKIKLIKGKKMGCE